MGQVAAHAVEVDDPDHDAVARALDRRGGAGERRASDPGGDGDPTPVKEFVRLFEEAHGANAGYESDRQGGWLFPFDDG